ncbi:echinoidin-like [Asterias amurensis]|uniref:echinoidin-like n=1 Tax=Asterias amurensis TaxID=7602 RepID=UPI003AB82BE7
MDAIRVILVVWVFSGHILAEICPPDWHRYGESCYLFLNDKMDWYEANRTCTEKSRATLAYPTSQSEQDYIWDLFLKKTPDVSLWLGCNDLEVEGNWQHCPLKGDGSGAYENWQDGEPNGFSDGDDCGMMKLSINGEWDDDLCTYEVFAVCKLPVCSVRLTPKCLLRHAMEELQKSVVSCGEACRSHPRCHSFNLLE